MLLRRLTVVFFCLAFSQLYLKNIEFQVQIMLSSVAISGSWGFKLTTAILLMNRIFLCLRSFYLVSPAYLGLNGNQSFCLPYTQDPQYEPGFPNQTYMHRNKRGYYWVFCCNN